MGVRVRLSRVKFQGYKRLHDASCSVEGRIVAFVGPNEAGKSSVLEALRWLTADDGQPLPGHLQTRSTPPGPNSAVVRVEFDLDPEDLDALSDIRFDGNPVRFVLERTPGGETRTGTIPPLTREAVPLALASEKLTGVRGALQDHPERVGETALVDRTLELLIDASTADDTHELATFLADVSSRWRADTSEPGAGERPLPFVGDDELLAALAAAHEVATTNDPYSEARERLRIRAPQFLLFGEPDRVLQTEYNLADDAFRTTPPPALVNLLKVADTDVHQLWSLVAGGDLSVRETQLKRCNRRLKETLTPTWRQSRVTVELRISATVLQVLVDELEEDGATVAIAERSDGLKTFLALVSFLAVQDPKGPRPVLLIDEAETHLHYDAQADLVDVLLEHVDAVKVLYTTHSPGCLPFDLGTGIRLVAPDPTRRDVSVIRHDFWQTDEPGFAPLLFAMGAGAAAFSVCRAAVLAEGPSDMILAPTLIRLATGEPYLRYQVAPGLAGLPGDSVGSDVAARLAYLVDGDASGRKLRANLLNSGVDEIRICALPDPLTIEDLIEPDVYVRSVNAVLDRLGRSGEHISATDLDLSGGIIVALKAHFVARDGSVPTKVAVAEHLVGEPARIQLTERGQQILREMHALFTDVLAPV